MDTQNQNQPKNTNEQLNLPQVTYRREVRVRLTDGDVARYGRQLADKVRDQAQVDEKRKAVAAEYSATIKRLDEEITRLSNAMQRSEELRDLEVYDHYHAGTIEVRRADTHEVVDVRPATAADRGTSGADSGFPAVDDDGAGAGANEAGDGAGEGEGEGEDPSDVEPMAVDLPKLELVASSTGGVVAHMPDDPGEDDAVDAGATAAADGDDEDAGEDPQWDPDDADAPRPPAPPLKRAHDPVIGAEVATQTIKHGKKRGPKGPRKKPESAPASAGEGDGDGENPKAPQGEKRRR